MNAFIKDIKILHRHKKRLKNSHGTKANNWNQDEQARVRGESCYQPRLEDEDDDNPMMNLRQLSSER